MSAWTMAITCPYVSHYAGGYLGLIYMTVVAEFKERSNPPVVALSSFYSCHFSNDSVDKASHVRSPNLAEKHTLPLAGRSCKINRVSRQVQEVFVAIVTIVGLKSTTLYLVATHY